MESPLHDIADAETLRAVAFAGEALAPLFLEEPLTGAADAQLDVLAAADAAEFARAWPFALEDDVDSHTHLVEFMRANGIIQRVDKHEPADHFGLMLHLMAWIAANKPDVLREYLAKHLFTWSSHFLQGLQEHSASKYYQGLALLTRSTLEGIQEVLAVDVVYPRYVR